MNIIASKNYNTLRDGGSHMHPVLNTKECGLVSVIQNHSIGSRVNQTYGLWYGVLPPPNHTSDKYIPLDIVDISFI